MSPAGVADAHAWPEVGRPWVRAIMVATADGAAKSPGGLSGGISNAGDRLLFNTIRGLADVLLVGAETVRKEGYGPLKDRPELESRRQEAGQADKPRLAIITRTGNLDTEASVFQAGAPLIFAPTDLPADRRSSLSEVAEVITVRDTDVDLSAVVDHLGANGLPRIVCEGGPTLLNQVAGAGLLDELCLTITPLLAGGSYESASRLPRILHGSPLPNTPRPVQLAHVLEDSGTLFLRYLLSDLPIEAEA